MTLSKNQKLLMTLQVAIVLVAVLTFKSYKKDLSNKCYIVSKSMSIKVISESKTGGFNVEIFDKNNSEIKSVKGVMPYEEVSSYKEIKCGVTTRT